MLYHIIPWRPQKKVKSIIGKKFLLPSSLFFHDCQSFLIILIESGNSKFPLLTRKLASICTSSWVNTQNLMIWLSNENDIQLLWHTQFLKYCVNTVLSDHNTVPRTQSSTSGFHSSTRSFLNCSKIIAAKYEVFLVLKEFSVKSQIDRRIMSKLNNSFTKFFLIFQVKNDNIWKIKS